MQLWFARIPVILDISQVLLINKDHDIRSTSYKYV